MLYFPVYKCINAPNDMSIVLTGCLDRMLGGNVDDRTCDQGQSGTCVRDVAAVAICLQSRLMWTSIFTDSEHSGAAASNSVCGNPFQIHDFQTSGDYEAFEAICMCGAHALTVPHIVHP